jgi:hypothetical protein
VNDSFTLPQGIHKTIVCSLLLMSAQEMEKIVRLYPWI